MASLAGKENKESTRWGDVDDEDREVEENTEPTRTLPDTVVIGPDADGIKTVIEYGYDEENKRVKITKRIRVTQKTISVNKAVQDRRNWKKFGAAEKAKKGPEAGITTFGDVLYLDLTPKNKLKKQDQEAKPAASASNNQGVSCRICKGDHWTLKCPYKDELNVRMSGGVDGTSKSAPPANERDDRDERDDRPSLSKGQPGKYVPPSLRDGAGGRRSTAEGSRMPPRGGRDNDDTAALRVTNLSEDASEQDLQELFRRFGQIQRIYLVRDKQTDASRGFAFIHFYNRSDAQAAMEAVNGLPYDHLILSVEWAKPRAD